MRRRGTREADFGALVLDSEGLSGIVAGNRTVLSKLKRARMLGLPVLTSSMTLVEASHPRGRREAFAWAYSRATVRPVTEEIAKRAMDLLAEARMHGHTHAIDAVLCATALDSPKPPLILTSDPDDLAALVGDRAAVLKV
ncbi:type II toxin-antitoxin system VapC family toxin [Myceligenerans xiligouense]|uniref:PIN domain-containing protein n=1 Tax=Myceligenerans xiligouense TaxID=253184 RepID=A0A3N4YMN1_9MICO|nr:DNA-binding protein [Myceligenerans xiligouense]RPF22309.1 hypothetical protein EDD34_2963 [Myceligenerans xiligouense]